MKLTTWFQTYNLHLHIAGGPHILLFIYKCSLQMLLYVIGRFAATKEGSRFEKDISRMYL